MKVINCVLWLLLIGWFCLLAGCAQVDGASKKMDIDQSQTYESGGNQYHLEINLPEKK